MKRTASNMIYALVVFAWLHALVTAVAALWPTNPIDAMNIATVFILALLVLIDKAVDEWRMGSYFWSFLGE